MSTPLNEQSRMGMKNPWQLHSTGGNLVLCAGDSGGVCNMRDVVAEPPSDARMGDDWAGRRHIAKDRLERVIVCVNTCAGIPEPDGVRRALEGLWAMAEDDEHEGCEDARSALTEMGFYKDEAALAAELMGGTE